MYLTVSTTFLVLLYITPASCTQDANITAPVDVDGLHLQSKNFTLDPDPDVFAAATCQGYRLSGANTKTSLEGTYTPMSSTYNCNYKPVYRMYSSGFGKYIYLYYYSSILSSSRWLFGDIRCGSYAHVRAYSTGGSQPSSVSTWQEARSGNSWATVYSMTVSCVTSYSSCYSCSGSGSSCVTSQYSLDPKTSCDIGAGYYCWQSYTTSRYGSTTVKRECKYGCPYSSSYSYSCSRTCSSGTCSKCCATSLCNDDSMSFKKASISSFCYPYGAASKMGSPAWQVTVLSAVAVCLLTLVVDD